MSLLFKLLHYDAELLFFQIVNNSITAEVLDVDDSNLSASPDMDWDTSVSALREDSTADGVATSREHVEGEQTVEMLVDKHHETNRRDPQLQNMMNAIEMKCAKNVLNKTSSYSGEDAALLALSSQKCIAVKLSNVPDIVKTAANSLAGSAENSVQYSSQSTSKMCGPLKRSKTLLQPRLRTPMKSSILRDVKAAQTFPSLVSKLPKHSSKVWTHLDYLNPSISTRVPSLTSTPKSRQAGAAVASARPSDRTSGDVAATREASTLSTPGQAHQQQRVRT